MLKKRLTSLLAAVLVGISPLAAYDYDLSITATRGASLAAGTWNAITDGLRQAYAQYPTPAGVNFDFSTSGDTLIWSWDAIGVTAANAREFRNQMQQAVDLINQQYQQSGLDIIWDFTFDGQGSTPVESASFDYPDAVDLGNNWCYNYGYGTFYVGNWPWVYNFDTLVWYYNAGSANALWSYLIGQGWGYTTADLYPWVFISDQGQWVYLGR